MPRHTKATINARVEELNAKRRLVTTRTAVRLLETKDFSDVKRAYYEAACGLENLVDSLAAAVRGGARLERELKIARAARNELELSYLGKVL